MKSLNTYPHAWRGVYHSAIQVAFRQMWLLLVFLLLLVSVTGVQAQRDIFNWEIGLSGGIVTGNDVLELPDNIRRYSSGLRLQRNLGRAWQLGIHAQQLEWGNDEQGLTFSGLSLGYFWDNGVLLKQRSFITPFHRIEGGYLARADYKDWVIYQDDWALALENGLSMRLGDRLNLRLSYTMYWVMEERFADSFERSKFNSWQVGVGYAFGARKLRYKGPQFDSNARFYDTSMPSVQVRPRIAMQGIPMAEAGPLAPIPESQSRAKDEPYTVYRDTIYMVRYDTLYTDSLGMRQYSRAIEQDDYTALRERLNYLEGYVQAMSRKDTVELVWREQPVEGVSGTASAKSAEDQTRTSERESRSARSTTTPAPVTRGAQEEKTTYQTDPALIDILKGQEALIANQNAMIREMSRQQQSEVRVEPGRTPRVRTQVAPTVMVPLNSQKDDEDSDARMAALESQISELRVLLLSQGQRPSETQQQEVTSTPSTEPQSYMPADTISAQPALPVETDEPVAAKAIPMSTDDIKARTEALRQRADSIAAATAAPASPAKLRVEYPAVFLFGLNRADTDNSYTPLLDKVAADLSDNAAMRVTITGYTDRSGNPDYNLQLSKRRAAHVRDELINRGVPAERIRIHGEGKDAATEKWSPGDRRVEVEIRVGP